ncbi:MAG: SagB/ThcOx family dehydrogenase [Chloroflexota bacterium]|nr:SagB/ThcOx family dehydrogenase [Chloroflexota bacterium]
MSLHAEQGNLIQIKLPSPQLKGKTSLEEVIARRRSVRRYKPEPLTLLQVSQILWSSQGITEAGKLRATPSAGASYPLEVFILIGKQAITASSSEAKQSLYKEDLSAGIYHYEVDTHSLRLHLQGDFRLDLARAALDQGFIASAPVDIVICTLYSRTCYTYGKRGERYIYIEVGHVGENIHLQAVALGLATVEVGAFNDEEVRKILAVEEAVKPLYIMPIGKPR